MRSDSLQWTLTLAPTSQGVLIIPVLHAGAASSAPLQINVVDAAFMPVVIDPGAPEVTVSLGEGSHYVQQEFPLKVRIEAGPDLHSAKLIVPQRPDFTLSQSGEDQVSLANANGIPVTTTKRTYMLRPQTDGTLIVPPITLKAVIRDPDARSPFAGSPFQLMFSQSPGRQGGNDPFARMFNQGREVTVRSVPITLDV